MEPYFWEAVLVGGAVLVVVKLSKSLVALIRARMAMPPGPTPEPQRTAETASETEFDDPKDTPAYLQQHGWVKVKESPLRFRQRYVGDYRAGDQKWAGWLERTASGRRKFFIQDPPPEFVTAAHNGRCLKPTDDLLENAYGVHFDRAPTSFGDGIERIEAMLEGADA